MVENLQDLWSCCRLDGGGRKKAGGFGFARQGGVKDNFGLVKGGLGYPPFLVAMISQLTRPAPGQALQGSFFGGALPSALISQR